MYACKLMGVLPKSILPIYLNSICATSRKERERERGIFKKRVALYRACKSASFEEIQTELNNESEALDRMSILIISRIYQ